ncbi:MAG: MrtC family glutamic-type intramembrane protease [Myxococcota bacterium]
MSQARTSVGRVLVAYAWVCLAVFAATRLESVEWVGEYVHLIVAAVFLLTALHLTRDDPAHYGVALGGLLEPAPEGTARGPLGLWDLGRAIAGAFPSALRESAIAVGVALVVLSLYTVGFYYWVQPTRAFALTWPPELPSLVLAQLLIVALPEEAFFRGYLQTALADLEPRRVRLLGVPLAPTAWLAQAVLFAVVHLVSDPHPARLAVVFPALLFGWVRAWRGGIGAAIALHALSNLYSETLARSWL